MMMRSTLFSGLLLLLFLAFTGCDDDQVVDDELPGSPPVADAGPNLSALTGSTVMLDGSDSYDPDGDDLSYSWSLTTLPEGSNAMVNNADRQIASFRPDLPGNYTARLIVDDGIHPAQHDEAIITVEEGDDGGEVVTEPVIIDSNISEETVWINHFEDPDVADYIVTRSINVNARLTIEPGVRVQVNEGAIITVESGGGTLIAEGQEAQPIFFGSQDEAGELRWGGILINSASTQNAMDYVNISFAGGDSRLFYVAGSNRHASIGIADGGRLSIRNSRISNSGGDGMFVVGGNGLTAFEHNTFRSNGGYPITVSINQLGTISDSNTYEDDGSNNRQKAIQVFDSSLSEGQEWNSAGSGVSYRFVGDVSIEASLSIHEGTRLEFNEGVGMTVTSDGVLKALGSADNPVVLTSANIHDGHKWKGLLIQSSSVNNELEHTEISHAGNGRLFYFNTENRFANLGLADGARLRLTNSTLSYGEGFGLLVHSGAELREFTANHFHHNRDFPLYIPANMAGMMDGNTTFEDNTDNVVAIYNSTFGSNAMFADEQNPEWVKLSAENRYYVLGRLTVENDLRIGQGAQLAFGDGVTLEVESNGTLQAIGSADDPIVFSSYSRDGNRNWGGILFKSAHSNNQFEHTEISYAGNGNLLYISPAQRSAGVGLQSGASFQVSNSMITHSRGHGIAAHPNSELTVGDGVQFSGNAQDDVFYNN